MEIEIYADVVCPWCYVGRARLDAALATFPSEVILRWRPLQLDPNARSEPLVPRLAVKFGGAEHARRAIERVTSVGAAEGLDFDFDRAVSANTFDAHRLLWFADQPQAVFFGASADTQSQLANVLHRAHFRDGLDISSHDVLVGLAGQVDLDRDRVRRLLGSTESTADVRAQIARAHDRGIVAAPTFVLAGRYAVAGAQDTSTLRSVLAEVARREGMAPVQSLIPNQRTAPACEGDSCVA